MATVKIVINKPQKLMGNKSAFISFKYDQRIVALMQSCKVKRWNPDTLTWEVSMNDFNNIFQRLSMYDYELKDETEAEMAEQPINRALIPSDYVMKTKPYEHQLDGIAYGLAHKKFLLADEQGLGKTFQSINIATIKKKQYGYKHCLIIACVNSLKYNWFDEVGIHSDEKAYILGTRYNKKGNQYIGSTQDRLDDLKLIGKGTDIDDCYFLITNIETLRMKVTETVEGKTNKNGVKRRKNVSHFPIVDEIQKLIKSGEIQMIIADEIHKCKDSTSQVGKALLSLDCDSKIALTGTPLMNAPIDLFTPLTWLGYENHTLWQFKQHYCIMGGFGGHAIVGYRNLEDIHYMLNGCMLRRLKEEVLDLPEKIYINEFVEMSKDQTKIYEEVLDGIRSDIDKIKLSPSPLGMLIRLRQVTGNPSLLSTKVTANPKTERLLEIAEEVVSNGQKLIVFSNFTEIINPVYEALKQKGYNPALYTGENTKERENEKKKFKENDSCKVICGTIGAMGTGLTLTEASTVVFLDEPWNRAIKDQAEDRAHRIGTKSSVNIITLMCRGTIDEKINTIVYNKGKMADVIVDFEEDTKKQKNVIDFLLS